MDFMVSSVSMLPVGNRDNLGIFFYISPYKHVMTCV